MDFILGVDPGLTGALAILNLKEGWLHNVIDMPTQKRGARSDLDLLALAAFFGNHAHLIKYAVVEDVASAPKQGVVSMFTFGKVTGIVVGMIAAHYIPVYYVKPSVWKFQMKLTSSKGLSVNKARTLWPDNADLFTRTKDGRAEAALIAYFGKRFNV